MTPLALELARRCFVSLGGDDAMPWTAESTLVRVSGSDMLMAGSQVWLEVRGNGVVVLRCRDVRISRKKTMGREGDLYTLGTADLRRIVFGVVVHDEDDLGCGG